FVRVNETFWPMRIAILNLMPLKEVTEGDFLRILGSQPHDVEIHWMRLRSHVPKHASAEHVAAANAKGWTVYCKTANGWQEYSGEIPTGIRTIDNSQSTIDNWYSLDGKKLNGEPTKKGVYIRNGRKVVK
ncbi:MAG: homoserine O-succinyltransferase, partial [Prevotella sp.]|nr:homoserine O-succinyltransferase [Prevotella sp.]